jgi:Lamin Tail Domain/Secretion system C-terminal sorting domain
MKAIFKLFPVWLFIVLSTLLSPLKADAQGRILINEYMPWPGNACGTPSEFIELLNMGPGPMNIGCYILTDGDFSVTIPPGTILQPGQFYVIAGQDFLPSPCTNINMNVTADLNWTTCNCTSGPIPSFGGGFLTDGGSANEQLVLLGPALEVIDAVARNMPVETSVDITTAAIAGCTQQTFNLDNMGIVYEIIGESAGRGNSFARKTDGACGWLKDTQQSGGGTNNTPGDQPALNISMFITEDPNCMGGAAMFTVLTSPAASFFPLDYILGYDADGNGIFTETDTYTTGIDFTSPTLEIPNLAYGQYAINIGPVQGCDYRNFIFVVGPCAPLNIFLKSFTGTINANETRFSAEISGCSELSSLVLEASTDGIHFEWLANIPIGSSDNQKINYTVTDAPGKYYRLNMINKKMVSRISPVLKLSVNQGLQSRQLSPNPFHNNLQFSYQSSKNEKISVEFWNTAGMLVLQKQFQASTGINMVSFPTEKLAKGLYVIRVIHGQSGESEIFKGIKE